VSFAAITLCVASQRVFIVVDVVYFVIDSVRNLSTNGIRLEGQRKNFGRYCTRDSNWELDIFSNFQSSHVSHQNAILQPPIQWVPGTLSLGVKRPGREADHSPTSSAEVKEWVELYLHSPIRLHGVVLS
jgi:hypothetical protein